MLSAAVVIDSRIHWRPSNGALFFWVVGGPGIVSTGVQVYKLLFASVPIQIEKC